jgi:hypothetical protein
MEVYYEMELKEIVWRCRMDLFGTRYGIVLH